MELSAAFRITRQSIVAFAGAGGKTSAMFACAREMSPAIVTTTTHLGVNQAEYADVQLFESQFSPQRLTSEFQAGASVILVTGDIVKDRFGAITVDTFKHLLDYCRSHNIPLFIEADGARQLPIKAPGEHEPVIPYEVNACVLVIGLSALGKPIDDTTVFRVDRFTRVTGAHVGQELCEAHIQTLVQSKEGLLKGVPEDIPRSLLINQVDSTTLYLAARHIASNVRGKYDNVVIGRMQPAPVALFEVQRNVAGVILAAGASKRFGGVKQLADWHGEPLIRHVVKQALAGGLDPVNVVIGHKAPDIINAIRDLPVTIVHNKGWADGQSSSVKLGCISAFAPKYRVGAALFMLVDQPFVSKDLISEILRTYYATRAQIVAPVIDNQRSNPVLFDLTLAEELRKLEGDTGGREVINRHGFTALLWEDNRILVEIDTQDDYLTALKLQCE